MYSLLLLWAGFLASVNAQFSGWISDQMNASICMWVQPRAALVRDTIYLDGGNIWWLPGLSDGQYGEARDTGNYRGLMLSYNLSNPFDAATNTTGILVENTISKAMGGEGNANGAAPNFVDGGMLANYAEFFMYGGALFANSELYDPPDADFVLGYQLYQYGPEKPAWSRGFDDSSLPDSVNRYIAYGAAVSAPSENKAWYFSGMVASDGGDIYETPSVNGSHEAQNVSDALIELNMENQDSEEWTNKTLPSKIEGRANPEAVWVPVGGEGIIVVLGGVLYPEFTSPIHVSDNEPASKDESPKFMRVIDVYDVANDEWYKQPTQGGPGTRTRGCAAVAPASDYSSFNIYYYGGYDGIDTAQYYDDVWVLSLPSFTWTQINNGTSLHARAGHKCFMPYPDQLLVFGGRTAAVGTGPPSCLDGGPVVNFNLTSGEWLDSYHPDEHGDYGVPAKVLETIGGDATGGATETTPIPSGWATEALGEVFSSSYDMSKISMWGPYPAIETQTNQTGTPGDDGNDGDDNDDGLPSYVAPVLGVVLGLAAVTATIVFFCLWRRRKMLKNSTTYYSSEDARSRIRSWIRGQPTEKAPTLTTSEYPPMSPELGDARADERARTNSPLPEHHEMGGTPIAELDDTSPPVELSDTGLTHGEILQRHSRGVSEKSRPPYRSYSSFSAGSIDRNSALTSSSFPGESPIPEQDGPRSDSHPVANTPEPGHSRGRMQSLSETMADGERGTPSSTGAPETRSADQPTPVSPPTTGGEPGEDYILAREAMVSPLRQSVFHEDEDSMQERS